MGPRIHVLMRPSSPRAVVVWRGSGPKRLVSILNWDLATDAFSVGQGSVNAQLDPRKSDLGPNGDWLSYWLVNHERVHGNAQYTALSRAPFLKPVELRYGSSPVQIWTRDELAAVETVADDDRWTALPEDLVLVQEYYHHRLQRDGWILKREDVACSGAHTWGRPGDTKVQDQRANVYHKRFQSVTVEKWVRGDWWVAHSGANGHAWDSHRILDAHGGVHEHVDWEWAEVHGNRLFWVSEGVLYGTERVDSEGSVADARVVQDLNHLGHLPAYRP